MANKTIGYFISIIQASEKITVKEKDILTKRAKGITLQKIAKKYKVSDERIRQIEEHALTKFLKKIYQMVLFEK